MHIMMDLSSKSPNLSVTLIIRKRVNKLKLFQKYLIEYNL